MKVNLINYDMNALDILLYTKNTRLRGSMTLKDVRSWPYVRKLGELSYMRNTIQSSWEFVDYTFEITGVTRAFTHQLVRTRAGSYAQESQRTVDVRDATVINTSGDESFDMYAEGILQSYAELVDSGMAVQDARGLLPTNIETSIIAKFNLRTLHDMALLRLCVRTQGEYQKVFREMCEQVFDVHPWARDFIKVKCAWDGVCAFPLYEKCPIQKYTKKADDSDKAAILSKWKKLDHEANPIAKNGRTM